VTDTGADNPRPDWATIPNAITAARLVLFVPLVAWVSGTRDHPIAATVLLVLFGGTDWIDGFLARRLGQVSRVGEIIDPVADRAGVIIICATMLAVGLLPWWALIVIVTVDLALFAVGAARLHAVGELTVEWVGKFRTAVLMTSLPLLTLSGADLAFAPTLRTVGLTLLAIGTVLHVVAGTLYAVRLVRTPPPSPDPPSRELP